jgi:hypothetical protein
MKKGSKEAKAWGRKMKRLREGKSTRKSQVRKTARRAYKGLKKRTKRSRCITKCVTRRYKGKSSSNWSF